MDYQERIDELERKIEAFNRKLEEVGEKIGQRIELKIEDKGRYGRHHERTRIFWGLAFIIGGFIWLGNQMDWFDLHLPIAAAALILIGIYLIVFARRG
jgi:hypothetical protein